MAALYLIAHIGHTIKSHEHVCWWRPDSCGYTICIDKAGQYSEDQARRICSDSRCIAVTKQTAATVSRGTPFYRKSNGDLAPLYDGADHVVVPNSRQAWDHLLANALAGCAKPDKPTPIGVKARAIYLPAAA